jgi:DNA-binding transcriptional regulator YiaG
MTPDEIKAARLRLGMTQAELATALGYAHKQSVSDLERGVMVPSKTVLILLEMMLEKANGQS